MSNINVIELLYETKKRKKNKDIKKINYWKKRLYVKYGKSVCLIGCPEYSNLGDSTICLAIISFLKKCGVPAENLKTISEHEFLSDFQNIKYALKKDALICGMGGGNMGNQWNSEEKVRRLILSHFQKNNILFFPQTIFYQGKNKREDELRSVPFYNDKRNLTLVAREKHSFETMKELYPDSEILLTPDIVLSAHCEDFGVSSEERSGVLFCVRNDAEKAVDDSVWEELSKDIEKKGYVTKKTDMYSDCDITSENRADCVRRKMQEFADSKLVITDRLHGMIFAAITATPCIVFSNYNHKIKGTYDWISYLPYIKFVESTQEAEELIPELLKFDNCYFDNSPLQPYFEQIELSVKEKYRG